MLPKFTKVGPGQIAFYVAIALVVAAFYGLWKYGMYSKPTVLSSSAIPALGSAQIQSSAIQPSLPTEWQKMSVTVEGNTGALLTTLATALFGAIGWLMVEARKTSKQRHMWAGFLAAFCTGVSLFCGAASQGHLVGMLSRENFNPYDHMYVLLNLAQFGFLGAGACFLAGFAFYDLSEEA